MGVSAGAMRVRCRSATDAPRPASVSLLAIATVTRCCRRGGEGGLLWIPAVGVPRMPRPPRPLADPPMDSQAWLGRAAHGPAGPASRIREGARPLARGLCHGEKTVSPRDRAHKNGRGGSFLPLSLGRIISFRSFPAPLGDAHRLPESGMGVPLLCCGERAPPPPWWDPGVVGCLEHT